MTYYKIRDLRNLDLNLYKFVASGINSNGYTVLSGLNNNPVVSGIFLVDGFPENEKIKLPCIALEHIESTDSPFQLGGGRQETKRFVIDVYSRSDGERDDLGEMIKDLFYNSMNIYDYNKILSSGYYEVLGYADFDNIRMYQSNNNEFKTTAHKMTISIEVIYYITSGTSLIT